MSIYILRLQRYVSVVYTRCVKYLYIIIIIMILYYGVCVGMTIEICIEVESHSRCVYQK